MTDDRDTCDVCGGDLEDVNAAWPTRRDVRCTNCGAGGYVTLDGRHRGPAFESLPQSNRPAPTVSQ